MTFMKDVIRDKDNAVKDTIKEKEKLTAKLDKREQEASDMITALIRTSQTTRPSSKWG